MTDHITGSHAMQAERFDLNDILREPTDQQLER